MKNINFLNYTKLQYKRFTNNIISFFSVFSFQTIIQIIYPPAMLFAWGVENFGVWVFLSTIPATLAVFNINVSFASRTEMSVNFEKKKYDEVSKIFCNSFFLVLFNMIIFSLISLGIFLTQNFNIEIFSILDVSNLDSILLLIILAFYFTILDNFFFLGITYTGNVAKYNYITLSYEIILKILIPLSGIFFNDLIYPAIILLIINFLKNLTLFVIYKNNKKKLSLIFTNYDFKYIKFLFRLSLSFYFQNVSSIIKNNGILILSGFYFGPSIVGLITTAKTLFYYLPNRFLDILNSSLYYEYSKSFGQKKFDNLILIFKTQIKFTLLVLLFFILCSLMFGREIYGFWLNYEYDLTFMLLFLIVMESFFFNLYNSIEVLIKAVNKFFKTTMISLFFSLTTLLITYILFNMDYSFYFYFYINLLSSLSILIFVCYFTYQFCKKIK
jgi:O-antigen/teichoic acid export membrane protein